ncbi:MAG: hypothetical protein FWD66_09240 [Paludibacter sp.]|nr:hypothetical protein [Paludibacter sp.]
MQTRGSKGIVTFVLSPFRAFDFPLAMTYVRLVYRHCEARSAEAIQKS